MSNLIVTANTARSFLPSLRAGDWVPASRLYRWHLRRGRHSDDAAAKGAITTGLLLALKNEVSRIGSVRVNAVAPGWTMTPKKAESGLDEEIAERAKSTMALKKLATPEDVASAIVVLSSDEVSGHITARSSRSQAGWREG